MISDLLEFKEWELQKEEKEKYLVHDISDKSDYDNSDQKMIIKSTTEE